jgi:hypothetical protein
MFGVCSNGEEESEEMRGDDVKDVLGVRLITPTKPE